MRTVKKSWKSWNLNIFVHIPFKNKRKKWKFFYHYKYSLRVSTKFIKKIGARLYWVKQSATMQMLSLPNAYFEHAFFIQNQSKPGLATCQLSVCINSQNMLKILAHAHFTHLLIMRMLLISVLSFCVCSL
jgi:hypothetical protein